MIDINLIRESPELVKENIKKKFQDSKLTLVDVIIRHDKKWREFKKEADNLRHTRNELTQKITKLKKEKKDASKEIKAAQNIPKEIKELEDKANRTKEKITEAMKVIPQMLHSSVPIGKDESENVELEKIGKNKVPDYEIFNHSELALKLHGADFDSGREVAGKGFYYLTGDLAQLHSAMLAFARDHMIKQGFSLTVPPFMIRSAGVDGVMSFEEKDVMMYKIEGEDLYLIGTSEHTLIAKYQNKTLHGKDLPIKLTAYSPCFRKEVGAHGIEEKGFYRVHQFEKQEMVVICEPEESYSWYDKMLKFTIEVFKELNVPVRVLECCSGDLADLKAKSCDVEAWSPKQKKYWEAGSLTNMEDAQARRLNIKIENKGKRYLAHTLNNTVIANPRGLIALMENNQQKDGSIKIPKALQPYMLGKKVIKNEN
jgi:seryl-tRNA synthetase